MFAFKFIYVLLLFSYVRLVLKGININEHEQRIFVRLGVHVRSFDQLKLNNHHSVRLQFYLKCYSIILN